MALIDELLVGLGFEYDPKDAKKFKDDLDKSVNAIKGLARIAITAATALTGLTVASTLASDEQGKLADEIGDTVENIDALQFASRRAGGSADGMTSSLRQLAIRAAEAARGTGSGVEAFGLLGISVTEANSGLKSTTKLLLEISDQFKNLSKAQQIELADKLGIRDSIRLLQQGPEAIRELVKEAKDLGVTTEEDAFIAREFQDSLTDIWQITKQLSRTLSRALAPILKGSNQGFINWFKTNKEIIRLNLPRWLDNAAIALKILTIAAGAFIAVKLITTIASLITLFKGLTIVTLAANAAIFLIPLLIAGVIAAVALLIEDLIVFFNDGNSFIGDMIDKFETLKTVIEKVSEAFKIADEFFKTGINVEKIEQDLFKKINDFFGTTVFKNINEFQRGPIPQLGETSNQSSTRIDKMEIIVQGAGNSPEAIANEVFNVFQQTSQDLNSAVEQ